MPVSKRNLYLGFGTRPVSRRELAKSRKEFKARVRGITKATRGEYQRLARSARKGSARVTGRDRRKLEQLFHDVYGPPEEINPVSKTRKRKKKKNPRKGKMPAGLR